MTIDHLHAFDRVRLEIDECIARQRPGLLAQLFRERAQADDVVRHLAQDRRLQPRMGKPLDLVHEVGRHHLPRAGLGEVLKHPDAGELGRTERMVARPTRRIDRKCRMWLVAQALADAHVVDAVRAIGRRCFGRALNAE
jgi:hypothetical protein